MNEVREFVPEVFILFLAFFVGGGGGVGYCTHNLGGPSSYSYHVPESRRGDVMRVGSESLWVSKPRTAPNSNRLSISP